MAKDEDTGYGKPPRDKRFKKGQSGNPKGRPKGRRNFSTDVKDTLEAPVQLKEKGRRKTVSTQQAALLRLREKALSGDARALNLLLELARNYNDDELAEAAAKLGLTDDEVLEAYNERLLRRAGKSQPEPKGDAGDAAQGTGAVNDNDAPDKEEKEDDDAWLN